MGVGQGAGRDHLNRADAFAGYEAVRHRLPPAGAGGACVALENLDALADRFDIFLLDAFGVLNIGETGIPGVPERVAGLQAAGKRVLVVSNAASVPRSALVGKYRRLGYDFVPDDVITSRAATLHALKSEPACRWGVMSLDEVEHTDLHAQDLTFLGDDPAAYDRVDGFLLLGSGSWNEGRQILLESALSRCPRPVLVANPDIVAPREDGFSVEPGHYAHRLADRTGIEPRFFGKPFANIYDLVFDYLGHPPRTRALMVGDSLHTDILGGQAAGLVTALIAGYGFFAGSDTDGPIAQSGIRPDFILRQP